MGSKKSDNVTGHSMTLLILRQATAYADKMNPSLRRYFLSCKKYILAKVYF